MPILVHLADEKNRARIARNGIAPGKRRRVVYFMPVTPDFYVSHQWLRELRRHGVRTLVGVYFRLPDEERVWAGRYNEPHREMTLGDAMRELARMPDPLGFELFMERKVSPREITAIRSLPQKTGWRYYPHAHGRAPCPCPACIKGDFNAARIRRRLDPPEPQPSYEATQAIIAQSHDVDELISALGRLMRKRRRADPAFMQRLMSFDDADLLEHLALTLGGFVHENSRRMLGELARHEAEAVREAAAESLAELDGPRAGNG